MMNEWGEFEIPDDRPHAGETWSERTAQLATPCPYCGGPLFFGDLYDWPIELGGEWVDTYILCPGCGIDHDWDEEALQLTDKDCTIIGWSLDGYFINGCEGPVRERKTERG